jgi:uncharacterized cupin superfamily protein
MKANLFEPDFDAEPDREGFTHRDAWLGRQAGARRLGASLYEVAPGQSNGPYHWHVANEEMLLVVAGRVAVRTPEGTTEHEAGEVVAFPRGERGAHQIVGAGDGPSRYLVVSEMRGPEIAVYPDSKKVGVREGAPGTGEGMRLNFLEPDAVDYWHGEKPPGSR